MRRCTDLIPIKNNSIRSVINMLPQRCHTMLNYSHRQPDRCVVFLCNLVIMMCEDSFLYYDTYVEFRLQKRCSFGGSGVQYGINPNDETHMKCFFIHRIVHRQVRQRNIYIFYYHSPPHQEGFYQRKLMWSVPA